MPSLTGWKNHPLLKGVADLEWRGSMIPSPHARGKRIFTRLSLWKGG